MTPWRTVTAWKSGDESSAKWRLEDKVWKVGTMAMKIMALVVYNVAWAEAYLRTQWHHDPSSRLTTIDMGRKLGRLLCHFCGGRQCRLGRGLPPYQVPSWSIQPFNHNRHGPQSGGLLCPPFIGGGEQLRPHLTLSPEPRPTSVPNGILIHPAVWPP